MSTHAVERERFQTRMEHEGMPRAVSARILRHAQTVQRLAELACSSEAADRDQVPCPETGFAVENCLCRDYGSFDQTVAHCGRPGAAHGTVPRYMVQNARAKRLIREWCEKAQHVPENSGRIAHFVPVFSGGPRGACVKIRVPSGATDDWGQTGICVPTR